jgi:hypothetical protein
MRGLPCLQILDYGKSDCDCASLLWCRIHYRGKELYSMMPASNPESLLDIIYDFWPFPKYFW